MNDAQNVANIIRSHLPLRQKRAYTVLASPYVPEGYAIAPCRSKYLAKVHCYPADNSPTSAIEIFPSTSDPVFDKAINESLQDPRILRMQRKVEIDREKRAKLHSRRRKCGMLEALSGS